MVVAQDLKQAEACLGCGLRFRVQGKLTQAKAQGFSLEFPFGSLNMATVMMMAMKTEFLTHKSSSSLH